MIIVAIDEISFDKAINIIDKLDKEKCMVKIGSITFNLFGHEIIEYASKKGFDIFLDLKLHDIPNTVNKTIKGLSKLPIKMLTVHISGGRHMLESSMQAVSGTGIKIFGVTALTSLSNDDTNIIFQRTASEQVMTMLDLAELACIDGVVCSPHELEFVNKRQSLLCVTPGIRIKDSQDDQKRVMTPKDAIELGADYLVIGRPITKSNDIEKSFDNIFNSIQ